MNTIHCMTVFATFCNKNPYPACHEINNIGRRLHSLSKYLVSFNLVSAEVNIFKQYISYY